MTERHSSRRIGPAVALRRCAWGAVVLLLCMGAPPSSRADIGAPPALRDVRIDEHLGERIPLDETWTNVNGGPSPLAAFFDGRRPVILTLFYTRCPMLCGLVLDGTARAMAHTATPVGAGYRALSVSIDPDESASAAAARRAALVATLPPDAPPDAWTFLTGNSAAIGQLAKALGFSYRYDSASRQFAHPAAVFVLTGDGRISRYLYGFDPTPADLDAALAAAAAGRVGQGGVRQLLLQCYRFVPSLRRHAGAVHALLAVGGALILLGIAATLAASIYTRRRAEGKP